MKYITLWTIQHPDVWRKILLNGRYVLDDPYFLGDEAYCNLPEFVRSYSWIVEKMEDKLGPRPANCVLPVWAWYQHNGESHSKPDLRNIVWQYEKGTEKVFIEMIVHRNRVVLSDFTAWHYILNYWFLPKSVKDSNGFEKYAKELGANPYRDKENLPQELKNKIVDSWNNVFDLDKLCRYVSGPKKSRSIQATLWEIYKEDIVSVKTIVGRATIKGQQMSCDNKEDKCDYCKAESQNNKLIVISKPKKCCGKCKKQTEQVDNPCKDVDNGNSDSF